MKTILSEQGAVMTFKIPIYTLLTEMQRRQGSTLNHIEYALHGSGGGNGDNLSEIE